MTFQAGVVSNPNGRPKGTGHRQQVFNALVEPHSEALFKKAIDLALEGNEAMLKLFLERMLPAKPTDEPIHIDLPSDDFNSTETISHFGLESLRAAISGQITPEEATRISVLLGVHHKLFVSIDMIRRLEAIEEQMKLNPR